MSKSQFNMLMEKLEEIRNNLELSESSQGINSSDAFNTLQEVFFTRLGLKTGWGRNELKIIFRDSVNEVIVEL